MVIAGPVVEQDEVVDAAGVGRGPGLDSAALPGQAHIQLRAALGAHAQEGVDAAVRPFAGREQLPVVGHARGVADADVEAQRPLLGRVFVAQETGGQVLGAALAGAGIGHVAAAGTQIAHPDPVAARAGHPAARAVAFQAGLGEYAVLAEQGVGRPRLAQVGVDAGTAAFAVAAVLLVDAGDQFQARPGPGQGGAAAGAALVDGMHHGHRHRPVRVGPAQAVVVHDVIDMVVEQGRLDLRQGAAGVAVLQAQAGAVALELRAVHAAAGVAGLAIAGAGAQLDHGVGARGPAQGQVGVPLAPVRGHQVAIAVAVIGGLAPVGTEPGVAAGGAGGGVDDLVEAVAAAGDQAAFQLPAGRVELRRVALEAHRAGDADRAPEHGLRALDHGHPVPGLR